MAFARYTPPPGFRNGGLALAQGRGVRSDAGFLCFPLGVFACRLAPFGLTPRSPARQPGLPRRVPPRGLAAPLRGTRRTTRRCDRSASAVGQWSVVLGPDARGTRGKGGGDGQQSDSAPTTPSGSKYKKGFSRGIIRTCPNWKKIMKRGVVEPLPACFPRRCSTNSNAQTAKKNIYTGDTMSRKKSQPTLGLPDPLLACTTLTLIKTEYWDRAGGGGNIRYEW